MTEINLLRKDILTNKSFCFYPYLEISTNPAGHLKPCCYFNTTFQHDNKKVYSILNDDTFDSFWNCEPIVSLRNEMANGLSPKGCRKCDIDGDASMRARSIKEYINNYDTLTLVKETIDNNGVAKYNPKRLELKPSNLCNLKCVMCNSYDSTQVAKELMELTKKYQGINVYGGRFVSIASSPGLHEQHNSFIDIEQPEWSDKKDIWDNFERIAPNLEVLSFAGGEPTIMPSVLKTLNFCVDNNYAKNITVFLSSNFTNLNKNFLELMPKFKKFSLIASIDGYDKVNDYCRFPSKWKQISTNYITAKQYMSVPNVKILTNITVSNLNVLNLTDLLYWLEERFLEYPYFLEWPFNINMIFHPVEQQVYILPEYLKEKAKDRLNKYLNNSLIIRSASSVGLENKIHMIINELEKPCDKNLLNQLKERIFVLDEHRGINISNYIPELADIFK